MLEYYGTKMVHSESCCNIIEAGETPEVYSRASQVTPANGEGPYQDKDLIGWA